MLHKLINYLVCLFVSLLIEVLMGIDSEVFLGIFDASRATELVSQQHVAGPGWQSTSISMFWRRSQNWVIWSDGLKGKNVSSVEIRATLMLVIRATAWFFTAMILKTRENPWKPIRLSFFQQDFQSLLDFWPNQVEKTANSQPFGELSPAFAFAIPMLAQQLLNWCKTLRLNLLGIGWTI